MINATKIWLALIAIVLVVYTLTIGFAPSKANQSNHTEIYSARFDSLYFALTSQKINHNEIEKSISQLDNVFEKDFVTALLLKRKQKFSEAFNLLKKYLDNFPQYYPYYDELVWLAAANDKLNEIEITLSKDSNHKFKNYLKALLSYQKGKYSESINLLENERDFHQLYLLSHSYRAIGNYLKANTLLDSCLIICSKEKPDYVKVIISKGSILLLSGKYNEAKKFYQSGYELALKQDNKKEVIKAFVNLAILNDYYGEVEEAQKKLRLAMELALEIEDIGLQALIFSETGVSFTYLGNIIDARKNYEKSLETYKKLKNYEQLANLSSNIGLLYIQTGNFSAAIKSFEEGLEFAKENIVSKIINLRGLGDVYSNISDYSKAFDYYNQAKDLSKKINNVNQKALSEMSIGTLFYNLNKPNKALTTFKQISNEIEEINDPYFLEDLYFKIALAYSDLDSLLIAEHYYRKALSISENLEDVYYNNLISTYLANNFIKANEFNKAESLLNKIRNKSEELGYNQLLGLQNLYLGISKFHQKKFKDAIIYLNKAEELSLHSNDFNTAIEAKYFSAQCLEKDNQLSKSEKKYIEAIELIEKTASSSTYNSHIDVYRFSGFTNSYLNLTDLYLRQSRFEDAFNLIEKFRARNTLKNLSHLKLQSLVADNNLLQNYYDLNWKLNSEIFNYEEKDSLKKIFNSVKNEIASKYNFNIDSIQFCFNVRDDLTKLSEDDLIVSYYFNEEDSYAFIVNHKELKTIKLEKSKSDILETVMQISPFYDRSNSLTDTYYNQDLFSFNSQAANKLYKEIFEPIKEEISGFRKLIFSLPVELSVVPLEFLVSEFNPDDSPFYYDNKKFLVEQFSLSYTPSVSVYLLQKVKQFNRSDKVLLVGDPKISNEDFAQSYRGSLIEDQSFNSRNIRLFPLKYSKDEIEQIESFFSDASVLLSDNATEEKFIENAQNKSVIHLSTHSFIHNDQPFILFSKDTQTQTDGFLEAGEIIKLKLNSELVVLSSCKSGLGAIDPTEGIIGMQKSFFEAGSKSVIVSLWDVNDKYTSIFMKSFYKFLSEGDDKAEALRKTKLFFKENYYSNPYYWAAFVLSGDNSHLNFSQSVSFSLKYPIMIFLIILIALASYKLYLIKYK